MQGVRNLMASESIVTGMHRTLPNGDVTYKGHTILGAQRSMTPDESDHIDSVRSQIKECVASLKEAADPGTELCLAVRRLQEADQWIDAYIRRGVAR